MDLAVQSEGGDSRDMAHFTSHSHDANNLGWVAQAVIKVFCSYASQYRSRRRIDMSNLGICGF